MQHPRHSTTPETTPDTPATRPVWPYPDIVAMTAHTPTGQWRKRHKGRDYYFGELARPDLALARWRLDWPRITAGQPRATARPTPSHNRPLATNAPALTPTALVIEAAAVALAARRLSPRTRRDYAEVARDLLCHLPPRFAALDAHALERTRLAAWAHLSPLKQSHRLTHARTVLRRGCERLGLTMPDLTAVRAPTRRSDAALAAHARSQKVLTPAQFRLLLAEALRRAAIDPDHATSPAELLLALNAGLGPNEIATLTADCIVPPPKPMKPPRQQVKPVTGHAWILQPRTKTAQRRAIPLWPETLAAVRAARLVTASKTTLLATLAGRPVHAANSSSMTQRLATIRAAVHLDKAPTKPTWYWFRYTFRAVSHGQTGAIDPAVARRLIMGHKASDIHDEYLGPLPTADLVAIADHVRRWALPPKARAALFGHADRPRVTCKRPGVSDPAIADASR